MTKPATDFLPPGRGWRNGWGFELLKGAIAFLDFVIELDLLIELASIAVRTYGVGNAVKFS